MESIIIRTGLTVGAAVLAGVLAGETASAQAPTATPAAAPVTPRTADGHPDLSGVWVAGGVGTLASGAESVTFAGRGNSFVGFEADGGLFRETTTNIPQYKPQYWDQITDNEYNGNFVDPVNFCVPLGVPRMGAPHEILNIAGKPQVMLLYMSGFNGYGGSYSGWDQHRLIWTDNRPHDPKYVAYELQMGDSVAHWDGDTMVIELTGFTDSTWLHKNGWMHGFNMKVTERLTRVGNTLTWQATVDDPEYLLQPWTTDKMVEQLNTDPNAYLPEGYPCQVREPFVSHVRSG